jgi:hypothetical protein
MINNNSNTSTSTERPWDIVSEFEDAPFSILRADGVGGSIADVFGDTLKEAKANADLIVKSVNNYDAVVYALKAAQQLLHRYVNHEEIEMIEFAEMDDQCFDVLVALDEIREESRWDTIQK